MFHRCKDINMAMIEMQAQQVMDTAKLTIARIMEKRKS